MAEVKVFDTPEKPEVAEQSENSDYFLRSIFIPADTGGNLGMHLSRTPWDPYPWVSGVLAGSCAEQAGVRVGDCVLEANGEDLLGLKIVDIAKRVRYCKQNANPRPGVNLMLWNSGFEKNNLNPQSLSRFASCLQGIAGLLECPVCLEIIRPPSWQCCHGHLICSGCRSKSTKCPICRVMLGRGRCIVADKLFHFLVQTLGQHGGGYFSCTEMGQAHITIVSM
ncbi:AAEL008450-PA [Aedes aegypti]|uniref:AAEL008450-PA n=1 Tax=Aedes aegypti TaxID=7159 RepID=Q16YR5_AEDAE|nr:AAEL008450-PA [Aedes aegypti]